MDLQQRTEIFTALGEYLKNLASLYDSQQKNDAFFKDSETREILNRAEHENGWFTPENIRFSLNSWAEALEEENIKKWISKYDFSDKPVKTIAVIMAGNIPLVGFHDFLSVLMSGNKVIAKLSSNDKTLLPLIAEFLIDKNPEFKKRIEFTEDRLENFDAVIATGSNNTSRYFDYYFKDYPNIIRKNRNSVAVITGKESVSELEDLMDDIFRYFGLGCRNVSKIYVPENYDFKDFFQAAYSWKEIIHNHRYINNYDYNKAVYLMSNLALLDNEFMLLKNDEGFSSPISVVFYEEYASEEKLDQVLKAKEEQIQCVVSNSENIPGIPFGKTQTPSLWDYADGIDTLEFLLNLN